MSNRKGKKPAIAAKEPSETPVKKSRAHFNANQTLILFQATSSVNPYATPHNSRRAAWDRVAELATTEGGFSKSLSGKTCQEKIKKNLSAFEESGNACFTDTYSEAEAVSLASTLDLVRSRKRAAELADATEKDIKSKGILKQEKTGAQLTRKALQTFRDKHSQASPPPERPSSPSQHEDEGKSSSSEEDAQNNPCAHSRPASPEPPNHRDAAGPSATPAPSVAAPASQPHNPVPTSSRSARSRRASPLPSGPVDITRALKQSLNNATAGEAERFARQHHLLVGIDESCRQLADSANRIANYLEGRNGDRATSSKRERDGADKDSDEPTPKCTRFETDT